MRWMTLALLALASAACNQILGLRATRQVDAAPPAPDGAPDAMWPTLTIARPVLASVTPETITSGWSSSGALDPPPMVLVGPIGGPLQLVAIDDQGHFQVPLDLIGGPYRIVYALPGDVPTEIQWTGSAGTFAVPLFGRADRGTPPAGAELEFKPAGAPASIPNARVLTTGLWTRALGLGTVGATYDFPYPGPSQSPSGPLGSLDGTRGDVEVLASCGGADSGEVTAFAAMKIDHLIQMTRVSAQATWTTPPVTKVYANFLEDQARLIAAVGQSSGTFVGVHSAGVVPSRNLAPFTRPVPGGLDDSVFDALYTGSLYPLTFANPFDGSHPPAPQLPLVVYGSYTETRVTTAPSGVSLTSGVEEIAPASTSGTTQIGYEVGIARQVSLGSTALTASNLPDGQIVTSGGQPTLDLAFDTDQPVSDCLVTVYKIAGTQLAPVRRYLVAQPPAAQAPMKLDTSVFAPMTDHVLAITCRYGSRSMTDFTKVSFPYEESTLYTATFRVQ